MNSTKMVAPHDWAGALAGRRPQYDRGARIWERATQGAIVGRARSGALRRSARVGYKEPAVVGLLLFSGGRLFFFGALRYLVCPVGATGWGGPCG